MNPTCKTCRWWKCSGGEMYIGGVRSENTTFGNCHRRSPVQSKLTSDGWPRAHADDFCGEHEVVVEQATVKATVNRFTCPYCGRCTTRTVAPAGCLGRCSECGEFS